MADDGRPRHRGPALDALGQAIVAGRDAATYLWQVPHDDATRHRIVGLLERIREESVKQGRREMPAVCEELLVAARAQPSPQQVDILDAGFDRLYRLWSAARSGLF